MPGATLGVLCPSWSSPQPAVLPVSKLRLKEGVPPVLAHSARGWCSRGSHPALGDIKHMLSGQSGHEGLTGIIATFHRKKP